MEGIRTKEGKPAPFSLAHYQALERELEKNPEIRLVIIDPAGAYIGRAGCDDHRDSELRALLGPLSELAAKHRVAVVLVKHLNKGATVKAVNKVSGSTGYVNAVRAAFIVAPDPEDPDRKLFLPLKFNIGPKPQGFAFRLKGLGPEEAAPLLAPFDHLAEEDRERLAAQLFRPEWEGRVDDDPDEVVGEGARKDRGPNKVEACADWLEKFLTPYAWPSDEIKSAAKAAGFTFDNVKEAKAKLGREKGLCNTNKGRFQGKWWSGFGPPETWKLRAEPPPPDSPLTPESPHNGASPGKEGNVGSEGSEGGGKAGGLAAAAVRSFALPRTPIPT